MKRRKAAAQSARPEKLERWVQRVRELLPASAREYVLKNPCPPVQYGVRINTLKGSPSELLSQIRAAGFDPQTVPEWEDFFWLSREEREKFVESAWIREGRAYLQSASSVLPVKILDPKPEELVLDLCAAPGGKTTHLAARMENKGKILAVEAVRPRFYRLKESLRRLGVTNTRAFLGDGRFIKVPEPFDRVLVDAPCSSDAALSLKNPESLQTWSERKIAEMTHKQRGLLAKALSLVRPGGRVVYATCSLAPEENEAVVDETLTRFSGSVELERPPLPLWVPLLPPVGEWGGKVYTKETAQTLRICPGERFGVFFIASFVRMA